MSDQTLQFSPATAQRASRASLGNAVMGVTAPLLLTIFMFTLIMPVSINLGGFRVSPSRVFLLVMIVPMVFQLLSGKVGRIHIVDVSMVLLAFWATISLVYHEGIARLPYSLITAAELLGGYMVGRTMIRHIKDFKFLVKVHLVVMLFLLPFSLVDFLTDNQVWAKFLDRFGDATYRAPSSHPRWGFQRVLTGFDHPILYGMFCSMVAANVLYIWRDRIMRAFGLLGFATFMTFLSLSSAPLLSILMQFGMMVWDVVTKSKWRLLVSLGVAAFIFLSIASDRGPLKLLIETMTFNSSTGWTRLFQWEYVSAEVMRNPIWGKGLDSNWLRPAWLHTSSIDSYWLLMAYRHGFPAIILIAIGFIFAFARVVRAKNLAPDVANIRTAYLITVVGVCFALGTVHVWNASAVYIYCYLAAGLWICEPAGQMPEDPSTLDAEDAPDEAPAPASRFNRYGRTLTDKAAPQDAPQGAQEGPKTGYSRYAVRDVKRNGK